MRYNFRQIQRSWTLHDEVSGPVKNLFSGSKGNSCYSGFKTQIGINNSMPDCQNREYSFNAAACAQAMARKRFSGTHGRINRGK